MARKRNRPVPALTTISSAHLEYVVGGRIAVAKGPDPDVVRGLQSLTEGVAALGQKRAAEEAGKQQQMGQIMQQMMGRRG